jgi:hypothetical protein
MGCGGGFIMNQSYVPEMPPNSLRLVILPAATDDPALFDTLFCQIFDDTTHTQNVVCPQEIRNKFGSDKTLPALLDKLASAEFSKENIKAGTTINQCITADELAYLRDASQGADIALCPSLMGTRDLGVVTAGSSRMRLLDLRSGSIIYENTMNMNVNYSGEVGKKLMVLGLIGFARDDYVTRFWDKFNRR